jgi:uncharacterized RDD family membrane protein YckC
VTDSQGQRDEPEAGPTAHGPDPQGGLPPAVPPPGLAPVPAAGPAPSGSVYGDVMSRVIAIVVDGILIVIVSGVLQVVAGLVFGPAVRLTPASGVVGDINYATVTLGAIIGIIVSFAYFFFLWTMQRATLGMRVLTLEVGNESDGATIAPNQAALRWVALFGPFALSQAFWTLPVVGLLILLASLAWAVVLLITTAGSPTKQGLHDRLAHTVVVKVVRRVA